MNYKPSEQGQALIVIALAAVVLFGFSALAIDGSRAFSDRRHAQNAADTAALAAALAYSRGQDHDFAAQTRATSNGYDGGAKSDVTVTVSDAPTGACPANTVGKDIQVEIVSYVDTTLARVVDQHQVVNRVTASSRSCGSYYGSPFNGNAIVALAPTGKAYDGTGTPDWNITGGGIFSNSSSSNAAYCNGAADITAPSVSVVGGTQFNCHGVTVGSTTTGASQYSSANIVGFLPRQPACNGTAYQSGGKWYPQAGADGSKVSFSGDMVFTAGLYCVTNSPGPFHGEISGSDVSFYMTNASFSMKFNGGGNLTASAPTSGEYKGILIYLKPSFDSNGNLIQTQALDMRGNGSGNVVGTIWAPSADVTMFGNSGTGAFNSQVIAYRVDSGGNANITIAYQANDNHQVSQPITLTLIK